MYNPNKAKGVNSDN